MRILVTGGAGYIGSVMTDVLIEGGHDVTVFDNLSRGHRDAISPRATFVDGDLTDTPLVLATLKDGGSKPLSTWPETRSSPSRWGTPRDTIETTSLPASACSRPCATPA